MFSARSGRRARAENRPIPRASGRFDLSKRLGLRLHSRWKSAVQDIAVIFEPEPRPVHCPADGLSGWRHVRSQEELLVNVFIDGIRLPRPRRDANPCHRPGARDGSEP